MVVIIPTFPASEKSIDDFNRVVPAPTEPTIVDVFNTLTPLKMVEVVLIPMLPLISTKTLLVPVYNASPVEGASVPIPRELVTYAFVNVERPEAALTLPVKLPVTSADKADTLNDPTVNPPVTSRSPLTLRSLPTKALLVMVDVPTTCKSLVG